MSNEEYIEVDTTDTGEFHVCVSSKTTPTFKLAKAISEWLTTNLTALTDDDDKPLFNKVNNGFNENSLKTFGNKPTCDVYIDTVEYDPTYDYSKPTSVKTFIIFYFKGANNASYNNACVLHDYLLQELSKDNFRSLVVMEDNKPRGIVKDTIILNSRLMTQPIRKQWGVMGVFELSHIIY